MPGRLRAEAPGRLVQRGGKQRQRAAGTLAGAQPWVAYGEGILELECAAPCEEADVHFPGQRRRLIGRHIDGLDPERTPHYLLIS
eukprot:134583-Pyramimonas_sp.AAC.1